MKTIDRFSQYIKAKGISLNSVDIQLGMANGYIGKQIKNHASIGSDVIEKIVGIYTDLNLSWLVTGKGEMMVDTKPAFARKRLTDTVNTMPVIDIKAAASYNSGYIADGYIEKLDKISLPSSLIGHRSHYVFQNWGDSMHPTLYDGDYVAASLIDPGDWRTLKDESIFVIVSKSRGINIKRIKNRLSQHGFIRCKSDNRKHPAFNIENDDIIQIWKVSCKLSFNLPNENETIYTKMSALEDQVDDLANQIKKMIK